MTLCPEMPELSNQLSLSLCPSFVSVNERGSITTVPPCSLRTRKFPTNIVPKASNLPLC